MISSSFSLSINIKSRVPVLLLVFLNGASKSYTISWLSLYQGDYSIRIRNICFLRFSLALCVNSFRECPLFPVLCDISLFFNIFGTD